MPVYEKAKPDVWNVLDAMVRKYHSPLKDCGLTFDLLAAEAKKDDNGDSVGAALKLHGYPCMAIVRVIGAKDRVAGRADVEIVIDGDEWPTWSDDRRDAVIDHELEHIELKTNEDGTVKRDDYGRPLIRIRKHDHQFGWFDSVVRRHGKSAIEYQQFATFQSETFEQMWLPFIDGRLSTEEPKAKKSGRGKTTRESMHNEIKGILDRAGVQYQENVTIG